MRCAHHAACAILVVAAVLAAADHALAISMAGPGGSALGTIDGASALELWLRADAGVTTSGASVTQWNDQSGNGKHAIQATPANQPTYVASDPAINNLPKLTFAGNDFFNSVTLDASLDQFSVYAVVNANAIGAYHNIIDSAGNGPMLWARNTNQYEFNTGTGVVAGSLANWDVVGGIIRSSGTRQSLYENGVQTNNLATAVAVPVSKTYNLFHRGATDGLQGDATELIVFGRSLNEAERIVLDNHLASKYDRAISGDRYDGDSALNLDHDRDVFGIGRQSASDAILSNEAAGLTLTELGGTLDNDDYLLAGHSTATNSLIDGTTWARDFYLDKTGALDATLTFDFTDGGLTAPVIDELTVLDLLYSEDGVSFSSLGLLADVTGDSISFDVPNAILLDGFYTLSITQVPEPSTFVLLGMGGLGLCVRRRRRVLARGAN